MLLKDVLRSSKTNLQFSEWTTEKPKRRDFPLSKRKGRAFTLTRKWRWCTVEFDALASHFRVIVAYHSELPSYQAVLGEALDADTRILARWEYHLNHPQPGWHFHTNCEDVATIGVGMTKPLGQKRVPAVHSKHRRSKYVEIGDAMNDSIALDIAAERFDFSHQTSLGF